MKNKYSAYPGGVTGGGLTGRGLTDGGFAGVFMTGDFMTGAFMEETFFEKKAFPQTPFQKTLNHIGIAKNWLVILNLFQDLIAAMFFRCRNKFGMTGVLSFFTVLIFLTAVSGCGGKGDRDSVSDKSSPAAVITSAAQTGGGGMELGIKAYNEKNLDDAAKIFDSILSAEPENGDALSWRGRVCFDKGEFEKAREFYEKALAHEKKPQFYVNLGDVWIALFNWDKALLNLNEALKMKKDQPNWYFSRGIVYTHKKMYKEALADFDAAIKLNPTVDGYFEDRGYALLGLGRTGEAMESFKKAAELNPSNFSSYYAMGMAQSDEGELKEAVGSFNKSIEVYKKQKLGYLDRNPKLRDLLYAKIFYERGNVYEQMGKIKEAKADMEEALKYAKDSYIIDQNFGFAVHANYGAVLKKTGDRAGSLEYYKKALCFTLNKTSSDDWAEWGKACLETGRDKEALEALGKAVNMSEPLPETHYYYGKALMKNGKKKEAAAEFRKFLSMDEGDEKLKEECRRGMERK